MWDANEKMRGGGDVRLSMSMQRNTHDVWDLPKRLVLKVRGALVLRNTEIDGPDLVRDVELLEHNHDALHASREEDTADDDGHVRVTLGSSVE